MAHLDSASVGTGPPPFVASAWRGHGDPRGRRFAGIMPGKRVPMLELDRVAERGVGLSDVVWALPVDERRQSRPPEHAGYFPRPGYPAGTVRTLDTARIVPWHDRTALLLCDFARHDGGALQLSPRAVLRSVVGLARAIGVEPIVGVELEFYLLRETPQSVLGKRPSQLVAVDERASVYGVVAASRNEPFAGAVRETLLRSTGSPSRRAAESGRGSSRSTCARRPRCRRPTRRSCSRARSRRSPLGQGCWRRSWPSRARTGPAARATSTSPCAKAHRHAPLHRRAAGRDGRAERAVRAHAELLPALRAAFMGGHDGHLGVDNRSAGLRVIGGGDGAMRSSTGRPARTRTRTWRCRRRSQPGWTAWSEGASRLRPSRRRVRVGRRRGRRLPATLGEATDLLERSALARDWLGDEVVEHCVAMRRAELAAQAEAVTDWETSRYLERSRWRGSAGPRRSSRRW